MTRQVDAVIEGKGEGDISALLRSGSSWTVG
jgi:hypothetical protein